LEAELFGHVRGAFTGAVGARQGRLEQAHKGTLFLDEVGTMSPALQAKLLRVLQEREFERVGDSHTVRIDVRVIAATHSDLAKMVAAGTFREDLYYRLNVIPVHVPALRDRRDDIPLLVQHFLQKLGAEAGRTPPTVSQDGMRRLMAHQWPGNVRQLENAVERAVAFAAGRAQIDVSDLPTEIQQAQEPSAPPPPAGGTGDAGAYHHELLPDIGLIGAQVGISGGVSWNPYEVGQGFQAGGFVDLPLARLGSGKLSYELTVALNMATSPEFQITDQVAYIANLAAGASNADALAGPPAAPFPVRRLVRTDLRLLQVSPFALKYTMRRLDAARLRPYVAAGLDIAVTITHQDPVADESLVFNGTAPFDAPLIGGQLAQA